MEWHTLNTNSFICTRNEDKAGFDECTILNSEKGNRVLGNFAIDEREIFKNMYERHTHKHTHTYTHILRICARKTDTRHAKIVQDFCECHRRLNKLEH
jgi:hypothetical protein